MEKFIEQVFYRLVYDPETANYYWHNYGTECCLKWGFGTVVVCALLVTLFFYFIWTNTKVAQHATLKSWFITGLWGWLITFLATEVIVAQRSQLEGMDAYIGQSGADILVFSIYNAIVGFSVLYLIFSTIVQLLSRNAKNIPWHLYRVGSQG